MPRRPRIALFCLFSALALAIIAGPATAASITNGDFATGDFSGWSLDTDGFGAPDLTVYSDFGVETVGGGNAARIEADYYATPGDWLSTPFDQVYFAANTLYQGLDLTAGPGLDIYLGFDWEFGGEAAVTDEVFHVGLNDGTGLYGADGLLGFLLETTAYGSGTFSTQLDSATFANAGGWSLDFQLGMTAYDAFGSYVRISNVTLETRGGATAPPATVPEPGTLLLLGSGLAGLAAVRRKL